MFLFATSSMISYRNDTCFSEIVGSSSEIKAVYSNSAIWRKMYTAHIFLKLIYIIMQFTPKSTNLWKQNRKLLTIKVLVTGHFK